MAVFSLTDSVVTNQDIVTHQLELGQVGRKLQTRGHDCPFGCLSVTFPFFLFLCTCLLPVLQVLRLVSTEDQRFIFSYLHPGCVIHQWEVSSRTVLNRCVFSSLNSVLHCFVSPRLDCSKLIPCSESLKTINIDDQFSPGRCQVIRAQTENFDFLQLAKQYFIFRKVFLSTNIAVSRCRPWRWPGGSSTSAPAGAAWSWPRLQRSGHRS